MGFTSMKNVRRMVGSGVAKAVSGPGSGKGGFRSRILAAAQAQEEAGKGAPVAARKDNMAGMAVEAKKGGLMKKKMVKKSGMSDKAGRAMKKTTADAKGRAMKKGK